MARSQQPRSISPTPILPRRCLRSLICWCLLSAGFAVGQDDPYAQFPAATPPYYRVQYPASDQPGELAFAVNYTIWIPPGCETLRGVIVHQHGCGVGSCKSGLTGAYDLHWQALAAKHDCALLSPSYAQPEQAECTLWCDPRNGSAAAFQKCLADLGEAAGHPELTEVPWALWGHSGGGYWAGGMALLFPERVAAAWLRSGSPPLEAIPGRPTALPFTEIPAAVKEVPLMCNLGTKEGVSVTDGRFSGVWPRTRDFFEKLRALDGCIAVAVDPLTSHECGNQRYLAIPWLDVCLTGRLPTTSGQPLRSLPREDAWLAPPLGTQAKPAASFTAQLSKADQLEAGWLPNAEIAARWKEYVRDTAVQDLSPPPAPHRVELREGKLTWEAMADVESGIQRFIVERDGQFLASVPERPQNRFGRPLFQNLQYSDTPTQPLAKMEFVDQTADPQKRHTYRILTENTVGLRSTAATISTAE